MVQEWARAGHETDSTTATETLCQLDSRRGNGLDQPASRPSDAPASRCSSGRRGADERLLGLVSGVAGSTHDGTLAQQLHGAGPGRDVGWRAVASPEHERPTLCPGRDASSVRPAPRGPTWHNCRQRRPRAGRHPRPGLPAATSEPNKLPPGALIEPDRPDLRPGRRPDLHDHAAGPNDPCDHRLPPVRGAAPTHRTQPPTVQHQHAVAPPRRGTTHARHPPAVALNSGSQKRLDPIRPAREVP